MATRSVATTDSLNTLRTTVNAISGTDIGDLATLGTTAKSSIVAAVNEINTSVTGTGFTMSDGTTTQSVVTGNTITFTGSTGIAAAVSATDTLTISLANDLPTNIYADVLGAQQNADGSNTYTEIEVKVITGESDGIRTSIIEGVTEGDLIIIEYKVSEQDSKSTLDKEDSGDDKRSPPPRGGPPGRSSGFKGGAGQ